jgi:hypothetical protein
MYPPYILYCTEKKDEVKAAYPNATFGELGKILGAAWGKMSDAQKKVPYSCTLLIVIVFVMTSSTQSFNAALTAFCSLT